MIDFYGFEDKHLAIWEDKLHDRDSYVVEGERNLVFHWTHTQMLDFLSTSEKTFRILNQQRKERLFDTRGLKLLEVTGRGKNTMYKIQPTIEFYYYIMLRRYENERIRKMPIHNLEYLNHLITGNGLLIHEDGAVTIPVVMDMAEAISDRFGGNPDAISQSLKLLRKTLKDYDYLVSGKDGILEHTQEMAEYNAHLNGPLKMHRAYHSIGGKSIRISGSNAVRADRLIRQAYKNKYEELKARNLIEEEPISPSVHVATLPRQIAEDKGFSSIKVHYRSVASFKAHADRQAIQILMMRGITFSELRQFMDERIGFWESYDLMAQARKEAEDEDPTLRDKRLFADPQPFDIEDEH